MKRVTALLVASVFTAPVAAQEPETLLGDDTPHGGFGGPVLRVTSVNHQTGVMFGGHGGWIIDHRLVIGGGAYGLVGTGTSVPYVSPGGDEAYLEFGYGGLEFQYILRPMKVVHGSVSLFIGGGGATYHATGMNSQALFVTEPGAAVTINLTRKARLNVGGSYRFVSGVNLPGLTDGDLGGLAGQVSLDFGKF